MVHLELRQTYVQQTPTVNTAVLDPTGASYNYKYHAYVAMHGDPCTTMDWGSHSIPVNLSKFIAEPVTYLASLMPIENANEKPFVFDSEAHAMFP